MVTVRKANIGRLTPVRFSKFKLTREEPPNLTQQRGTCLMPRINLTNGSLCLVKVRVANVGRRTPKRFDYHPMHISFIASLAAKTTYKFFRNSQCGTKPPFFPVLPAMKSSATSPSAIGSCQYWHGSPSGPPVSRAMLRSALSYP